MARNWPEVHIANKDGKILPGDIIHESAYTSTSLDRGIVEKVFAAESEHKEEPVLVSINVPSKTRGIYMDSISSYKEERRFFWIEEPNSLSGGCLNEPSEKRKSSILSWMFTGSNLVGTAHAVGTRF